MRRFLEDVGRFLGIAQGIYFVVVNLGIGIIVLGVVTGFLALASDLPGWSIALMGTGAFVASTGAIGAAGSWIAGLRASPITPVIERGLRLRAKLAEVKDDDPAVRDQWKRRVEDWVEEAETVLSDLAPHRLGAFRVDYIWADEPRRRVAGRPIWVHGELAEIDVRLERLELIRATI